MEAAVYNQQGEKSGKINLPEDIFGLPWNNDLVHQVVVSMEANSRVPVADSKGRGEVSGSGKKPWRQKGTGRARHGSVRSPIWRGGGVTHGPTSEKNFSKKVNKSMKEKALFILFSQKLRDNEILFVDKIIFEEPKTKQAAEILKNISKIKGFEKISSVIFAVPEKDQKIRRAFSNIPGVEIFEARNLNPFDVAKRKYLVLVEPEKTLIKK